MLSAMGLPTSGGAAARAADIPASTEIDAALNAAYEKYRTLQDGKNADYIPALSKVDPKIYGIALVTNDGRISTAGDVTSEVSIQSISKVFTMAKVIEESGPQSIEDNIGVDSTGHIKDNPAQATDIYTKQCSVNVNAKDLATMAATLANGGKNPVTGKQVLAAGEVPEVLAVMATAGLYDESGKWLYDRRKPYAIKPRE
jgi:glutaminase